MRSSLLPSQIRRVACACVTATLLLSAAPGHAEPGSSQDSSQTGDTVSRGSESDTDLTLTVMGLVTTVSVVAAAWGIYRTTAHQQRAAGVAEAYLRHHALQLRQELALGRGPLLRRLARGMGLTGATRAHFERGVMAQRLRLLDLAHPQRLTPTRALSFFATLRAFVPALRRTRC